MDVMGGVPARVTWHPAGDTMLDWCPDGEGVVIRSNREYPYRGQLFKAFFDGRMPMRLPVDRGSLAAVAPDHSGLAYNRIGRQARTWKRYEGGMAQDIWVKDFASGEINKITDWDGTDNFPMWEGNTIYFTSDREDGTLNIYGYDTTTRQTTRLTQFSDYDVKYPSIGDGKIVFQHGAALKVLDIATGEVNEVPINIPSDRRHVREDLVKAEGGSGSFGLSPGGERVLVETRGEILNLPADEGDAVNLTRASGSREKNAAWSPDGRWVSFVSDKSGEEAIYLVDQRGEGEWKKITDGFHGFMNQPVWSPDSKYLVFSDKYMKLHLVNASSGKTVEIAHSDHDDAWERWGIMDYVWSADSKWIAFTSQTGNMNEAIWLYDVAKDQAHKITDDMTNDWSPSFSGCGKYLFFLTDRTFDLSFSAYDTSWIYANATTIAAVPLRADVPSPVLPRNDVEEVASDGDDEGEDDKGKKGKKDGKGEDDEDGDGDEGEAGRAPVEIDLDGLEGRTVPLPLDPGNYADLFALEGKIL